ncbi:sigma factor-like helix-turn-helix DNA-binding protein [Candidatus Stoquefichus massiliensis]|uniref:sigma factor-like helix-turn-helix DNA-binding protein n=1 Tax=Candidatus Stoquefichus massiliensis TaxID=1470350 RepID=UPI000481D4E8|nr:sigma factor-like helix-turn-helix DNA-binding protein [Candidatus Stoquefichus massiliensis]
MIYNKAREEKLWLLWKTKEENLLHQLGVDEKVIDELHEYDWKSFNQERKFLEKHYTNCDFMKYTAQTMDKLPINNIDDIIDYLDNEQLLKVMKSLDDITLKIIYMKILGYSYKEISMSMNLSLSSVKQRVYRVRKKIKKIVTKGMFSSANK